MKSINYNKYEYSASQCSKVLRSGWPITATGLKSRIRKSSIDKIVDLYSNSKNLINTAYFRKYLITHQKVAAHVQRLEHISSVICGG